MFNRNIAEILEPANIFRLKSHFRHHKLGDLKQLANSKLPNTKRLSDNDIQPGHVQASTMASTKANCNKSSAKGNQEIRCATSTASSSSSTNAAEAELICSMAQPGHQIVAGPSKSPGPAAASANSNVTDTTSTAAIQTHNGDQSTSYKIHSNRQVAPPTVSSGTFRIVLAKRDECQMSARLLAIKQTVDRLICILCGHHFIEREVD